MGTSFTKTYPDGKQFTCEVLANPSHLECINPVVMGKVRAENHFKNVESKDHNQVELKKVVPVLVHGDAALSG